MCIHLKLFEKKYNDCIWCEQNLELKQICFLELCFIFFLVIYKIFSLGSQTYPICHEKSKGKQSQHKLAYVYTDKEINLSFPCWLK